MVIEIEQKLIDAAFRASTIFETEEWTYGDSEGSYIPTHDDIITKLYELVNTLKSSGKPDIYNVSSGRLSIEKDDLIGYRIRLEIGDLTEAEFNSIP